MATRVSRDEARWLAVVAQGLDRRPFRRRPTKLDILKVIRQIGCVQLDTISVISRSHETVLWSRLGAFDPALIAELYDPDHAITEYWVHAAAILPVEMMPLFRAHMEKSRAADGWAMVPENRETMNRLLTVMAESGPLSSLDFDAPEDVSTHQWDWYGKKPERRALEALWTRGETVLRRRDGFRRVFDLPEQIVPGLWDGEDLTQEERHCELVTRAVRALGVATPKWTADYFRSSGFRHVSPAQAKAWLQQLEDEGQFIAIDVPGIDEPIWMDAGLQDRLEQMRAGRTRPTLTTFLSPFDNLIWNRGRAEQLWDFHYRIEVYTPSHKRRYGYYSLPILHRGKIVGRLDPSFDRKSKYLTIKALHLEPWVRLSPSLVSAISGAIEDLVQFLGGTAGSWHVLQADPPDLLTLIDPGQPDVL